MAKLNDVCPSFPLDKLLARKTPLELCTTGAIGAGKSTLVNIVLNGLTQFEELANITKWLPEGMESLIESGIFADYITDINKKIEEQKNLAYIVQHGVMIAKKNMRKSLIKEFPDAKLVITERSVYDDRYIFTETLHKRGCIAPKIWDLYETWFADTLTEISFLPSAFVFIDLPIDICIKRMTERDRKGEDSYDKDYLQSLTDTYRDTFGHKEFMKIPCYQFPSEFVVRGKSVKYPNFKSDKELQHIIIEFILGIITDLL